MTNMVLMVIALVALAGAGWFVWRSMNAEARRERVDRMKRAEVDRMTESMLSGPLGAGMRGGTVMTLPAPT